MQDLSKHTTEYLIDTFLMTVMPVHAAMKLSMTLMGHELKEIYPKWHAFSQTPRIVKAYGDTAREAVENVAKELSK